MGNSNNNHHHYHDKIVRTNKKKHKMTIIYRLTILIKYIVINDTVASIYIHGNL